MVLRKFHESHCASQRETRTPTRGSDFWTCLEIGDPRNVCLFFGCHLYNKPPKKVDSRWSPLDGKGHLNGTIATHPWRDLSTFTLQVCPQPPKEDTNWEGVFCLLSLLSVFPWPHELKSRVRVEPAVKHTRQQNALNAILGHW